jgi:hypothetical protein
MKYLRTYENVNKSVNDMVNDINDVCLELSDLGFYTTRNGRELNSIVVQQAHGPFANKRSYVGMYKGRETFYFDEIKDCIYRIKDIVGIENISTFNYGFEGAQDYIRCDMNKLENENLNINGKLRGAFIAFNFPIDGRGYE